MLIEAFDFKMNYKSAHERAVEMVSNEVVFEIWIVNRKQN